MPATINIPANQVYATPGAHAQQRKLQKQESTMRDLEIQQAEYEYEQRGKPDQKELDRLEKHRLEVNALNREASEDQREALRNNNIVARKAHELTEGTEEEKRRAAGKAYIESNKLYPSTTNDIEEGFLWDPDKATIENSIFAEPRGGTDNRTAIQKNLDPLLESEAITQEQYDAMIIASHTKAGPTPPKASEKDKEIDRYIRVLGLSEEFAVKVAYGVYSVKPNAVTGEVQVIDEIGQVVQEIPVERDDVPTPSPEKGKTLWDLATYATGPINTVAAAFAVPLAWINMTPSNKVIAARQTFKTTNQGFIRALVNNKRYPVAEVTRIMEEINLVPTFLDDPKLMRVRMGALRDTLALTADQATRDAKNASNPAKMRAGAKQAASDINNYLAILGEPTAPQAALDALADDPSLIDQFEEHYGYKPEGY